MSRRWLRDKKHEHFYRLAKKERYRSRAAYKLVQLHFRFRLIRPGSAVVDLGAAPGGWSQVASELAGRRGRVVAVDRAGMKPLPGVVVVRGDIRQDRTVTAVLRALGGRPADAVVSDMSPNISGNYSIDHARSIELCEAALEFARRCLRPGGHFAVKVFQGDLFPGFLEEVRGEFGTCRAHHPAASRAQSSETYIVAKGFRGPPGHPATAQRAGAGQGPGRGRAGAGGPPGRPGDGPAEEE